MNAGELFDETRNRLNDAVGDNTLRYWSPANLASYANAARDRLFLIVRKLVIDSTTALDTATVPLPLCTLSIVAGTAKYALSKKILSIIRLKLASQHKPLSPSTVEELVRSYDWQALPAGDPWTYCIDLNSDSITFVPTPKTDDIASLTVYRYPLARLSHTSKTAELGFREEYHEDLIHWMMHLAFRKQDSEVYNQGLAEEYRRLFLDRAAEIKLEVHRQVTKPHGNRMRYAFGAR